MKNTLFTVILSIISITAFSQLPILEIGDQFPSHDEKMECTTSSQSHAIENLKGENGLLLIFSCNACPFVVAWEDRYPMVNEIANENNIGFALINSNHQRRDGSDSREAMVAHAKKHAYQWPYLIDKESALANAFGAQTTPHVFLFDKNMKLVYKGAIDDNHKNVDKVDKFYLKDALNSLGDGQEIDQKETRNLGCSIKRKTI